MSTTPTATAMTPSLAYVPRRSTSTGPSKRPDFVPKDYTELFAYYYPYVHTLVVNGGIDYQSAEDVTMTILAKFLENDVLTDFNPSFTSHHDGITRKAVFRTFLSGFVKIYLRHYLDRQRITKQREPVICDMPTSSGGRGSTPSECPPSWAEVHGPQQVDRHDSLETQDLIDSVRFHLELLEPEPVGKCPLSALFEAALLQVRDAGRPCVGDLALQFGVSETTVRTRLATLRDEVHLVFAE